MPKSSLSLPAAAGGRSAWFPFRRSREGSARRSPAPVRVVKRGWLGSLLAPIGLSIALLIVAFGFITLGTTWWLGLERDRLFTRPVQSDGSEARIGTDAAISETVTILARDGEGRLVRRIAERQDADRYVNEAIARLDAARDAAKAQARAEIDTLFALAFADRDAAIDDYADWFFAWKRPYVVLKEAVVSVVAHIAETGEYEPLATAVERDLQTYFIRHYSERVLKPDFRDPMISAGFEQVAQRAFDRWRQAVVEEDLRLQLFLQKHTAGFAAGEIPEAMSSLTLDWRSQSFRAPTHLMDESTFDGMVSLATIGAGGTIGAYALGPVIERTLARSFSGLGRRYAAAFGGRIAMAEAGAVAGTAVHPVGGTVLGAVAGGALGLALDYMLAQASEALDRDGFVAANEAAVASTIETWTGTLGASADRAIDHWFDQSRAGLVAGR